MIGRLVTFGYVGLRGSTDLRSLLDGKGVETVVDIRLNPYSRNRAFSIATRQTVEAAGFQYIHLGDLGNLAYKSGAIEIKNIEAIAWVLRRLQAGSTVALMCGCLRYWCATVRS